MITPGSASADAIRHLGQGPITVRQLDALRDRARRFKPSGYDEDQRNRRDHLEGNTLPQTVAALKRRFPKTFDEFPRLSFSLLRHVAITDAGAYETPPERWIEFGGINLAELRRDESGAVVRKDDGTPVDIDLDDAEERSSQFANLVREARLNLKKREQERRLMAGKTVFAFVGWDQTRHKPIVRYYYPCDVDYIPHHSAPEDLDAAVCLMVRVQGPETEEEQEWTDLWHRTATDLDDGTVEYGPWIAERIGSKSGSTPLYGDDGVYPLRRFPWMALHDGLPDGSVFLDVERDLVDVANEYNANWCSHLRIADMHGFPPVFITGAEHLDGREMEIGPGRAVPLPEGALPQQFSSDVNSALTEANAGMLHVLSTTRQQSQGAYEPSAQAPASGVARQIQRIPQKRALDERKLIYKDFEESKFLPVLVEVSDYWGGTSIAHKPRVGTQSTEPGEPLDVAYRVQFADEPEYEDPEARQRRERERYDLGLITYATLSVRLGEYDDEDEAIKAYGEWAGQFGVKPPWQSSLPSLSQRLAEARPPVDREALRASLSTVKRPEE